MSVKKCNVEGCDKAPRTPGSAHCEAHYYRLRRKGTTDDPAPAKGSSTKKATRRWTRRSDGERTIVAGYVVLVGRKGHPLADKYGQLYEHRAVLYDKIGPGTHDCNWCGVPVTWGVDLTVDHLDCVKNNNEPENLVPACAHCNRKRGIAHYWFSLYPEDFIRQKVICT